LRNDVVIYVMPTIRLLICAFTSLFCTRGEVAYTISDCLVTVCRYSTSGQLSHHSFRIYYCESSETPPSETAGLNAVSGGGSTGCGKEYPCKFFWQYFGSPTIENFKVKFYTPKLILCSYLCKQTVSKVIDCENFNFKNPK